MTADAMLFAVMERYVYLPVHVARLQPSKGELRTLCGLSFRVKNIEAADDIHGPRQCGGCHRQLYLLNFDWTPIRRWR